MGVLVAVEGLDGAGKATLVRRLVAELDARGARAATVAFPRYDASEYADLAAAALRGEVGDFADSAYAMAYLFALDRRAYAAALRESLATHDVVIADRYVASNIAFSAARTGQPIDGAIATWITDLEFGQFTVPRPGLQVFLDVSFDVARAQATSRAQRDQTRALDRYERDDQLQQHTRQRYLELAAAQWISPWRVVRPPVEIDALLADLHL